MSNLGGFWRPQGPLYKKEIIRQEVQDSLRKRWAEQDLRREEIRKATAIRREQARKDAEEAEQKRLDGAILMNFYTTRPQS